MSTMVYFDTLYYVKTLRNAGFSEQQAEVFAKVQQESLSECLDTTLATKADIYGVKAEVQEVRTELQEVKMDVQEVKAEVRLLRWMIGATLAGVGAILMKLILQ